MFCVFVVTSVSLAYDSLVAQVYISVKLIRSNVSFIATDPLLILFA